MKRAANGTPLEVRLAARSEHLGNGCIVWTGPPHDEMGYACIGNGHGRMVYVHRAAWELANGPVPAGLVLRHTCDTPPCLNLDHLILGTQRENVADMHARGRCDRRGERNNAAKLTWPQVREIRSRHSAGASHRDLARAFAIGASQVGNIVNHRKWKESA